MVSAHIITHFNYFYLLQILLLSASVVLFICPFLEPESIKVFPFKTITSTTFLIIHGAAIALLCLVVLVILDEERHVAVMFLLFVFSMLVLLCALFLLLQPGPPPTILPYKPIAEITPTPSIKTKRDIDHTHGNLTEIYHLHEILDTMDSFMYGKKRGGIEGNITKEHRVQVSEGIQIICPYMQYIIGLLMLLAVTLMLIDLFIELRYRYYCCATHYE